MEIKDVEKLLSVSRSNIRFYEKEGLINPERNANILVLCVGFLAFCILFIIIMGIVSIFT